LTGLLAVGGAQRALADAPAPRPGTFRIVESSVRSDGSRHYLADASEGPKACGFEIVIGKAKPTSDGLFGFAPATILRKPGADCRPFLRGLATELGYRGKLPAPRPAEQLAASVAILGENQSRASLEVGYSSEPPGNWTVTKLFLADGEGEVFLNLDAVDHVGEFSVKDEDYAQIVITELARIMLRRVAR
jgi:hypothetical protein